MVLWICLAVVVLAIVVLAILVFDLVGHVRRLQKAVETTRADITPYIPVVMSLTDIARPTAVRSGNREEPTATHT